MSFFSSLSNNETNNSSNQVPKIYLQCNGSKIQFPIPPSGFEVNTKQNNSIVNINNIGELNMLGKTGLLTVSMTSFFPNQDYPFLQCTRESDPYNYVGKIENWRTCGKPSRFIISGTPVNYAVSIDSFKWGTKDGSGDVYFTIDFKEYKFIGGSADNTQVSSITGLKDRESLLKNTTKNITMYSGDSLMDVASRTLGINQNLGSTNTSYLTLYKTLAKLGGLSSGSVLTVKNSIVKLGDKNVFK